MRGRFSRGWGGAPVQQFRNSGYLGWGGGVKIAPPPPNPAQNRLYSRASWAKSVGVYQKSGLQVVGFGL